MNNFYPGMKVVCINDDPEYVYPLLPCGGVSKGRNLHGLTKGQIYTINNIFVDPETNLLVVYLDEITRPEKLPGLDEVGFYIGRFRPVKETGLDILHAIAHFPGNFLHLYDGLYDDAPSRDRDAPAHTKKAPSRPKHNAHNAKCNTTKASNSKA